MATAKRAIINGKEYVVRSKGPNQGFGIVDVSLNAFIYGLDFNTRVDAWDELRLRECHPDYFRDRM